VLVIGATGVAAELCKNIVLAGINSLTLLDPQPITHADLTGQFLVGVEQIGENVSGISKCLHTMLSVQCLMFRPTFNPTHAIECVRDTVCTENLIDQRGFSNPFLYLSRSLYITALTGSTRTLNSVPNPPPTASPVASHSITCHPCPLLTCSEQRHQLLTCRN
jgi:hypothetical protein